jgi:uncharacterized membrane protein YccF (DUF307 family)
MASMKMLLAAAVLTLAWIGVAAVCFASIATVPASLATISHQRPAAVPAAPVLPSASVATADHTPASTATP